MENEQKEKSMPNVTTKELFERLRRDIENYDPADQFYIPKEKLQEEYAQCEEVANTLTKREMLMIWRLRRAGIGVSSRFARIAEQLYNAEREIKNLCDKK